MKLVLISLHLKNIGLIESIDLSFKKGFTVFTGQTGSGKSLLFDSLNSLLVGTSSSVNNRLVRVGSDFALIEASFTVSSDLALWLRHHSIDLDSEEDIIISREWRLKDGKYKTRSRINGILVNRQQIKSIKPLLIDFTLQGDTASFNQTSNQISLVDRLGLSDAKNLLDNVSTSWKLWNQSQLDIIKYLDDKKDSESKFEELKFMLNELETANLNDPDEIKILVAQQDRLVNGVKLTEGLQLILNRLNNDNFDYPNPIEQLNFCINELQKIVSLDKSLNIIYSKFINMLTDLQDITHELEEYFSCIDSDFLSLEQFQSRLALLKRLERKYDLSLSNLLIKRDELRDSLFVNEKNNQIEHLKLLEQKLREKRDKNNLLLSEFRSKISNDLENNLIAKLIPLELKDIRFKVEIKESEPSIKGKDQIRFLFSANPGQPLAPLSEIASGGERSRFLLAMKSIVASLEPSTTLIFDEIDSGVSGTVSCAIAQVLKDLSESRQVFCVTHQPLIAAAADNHFSIQKTVKDGITTSNVVELQFLEERKVELASLAGGQNSEITAYAASLLEQQAA